MASSSSSSSSSQSFKTWQQLDQSLLWPIVAALLIGLVLLVRQLRRRPIGGQDAADAGQSLPTPAQTRLLIRQRRTIGAKEYTGERVSDADIRMLLDSANWAPTHGKTEPWRFVVISGQPAMDAFFRFIDDWMTSRADVLSEETMRKFRNKFDSLSVKWPAVVSHLIVIVSKRQARKDKLMPEWEEIAATSMAVQNMHLLATTMERVGVFWSSMTYCKDCRDSTQMLDYLDMEREDKCLGLLTVGKYAEGQVYASTRGDVGEKVQFRGE